MKIKVLAFVFAFTLTAFTVFAVLDTFVISKVYQAESADEDLFRQSEAALAEKDDPQTASETEDQLLMNDTAVIPDQSLQTDDPDDAEPQNNSDDDPDDRRERTASSDNGNSTDRRNGTSSSDNQGNSDDWDNWGDSSDNNTNNSENWWYSADDNTGDSEGWGNRWSSSDDNDGGSGNWGWGDDSTNDGPATIDVTEETALEYKDENIQISITLYEVNDSTVYAADIRLSSAEYLKSALARDSFGRNVTETTSDMASDNNAILAINGDYYGARESGYVIRNGVLYRDSADDADVLCIYADGTMEIIDPSEVTAQELVDQGVWQAYSFGPALVIDGEIEATSNQISGSRWRWGWGSTTSNNPRTAIGIYEPLHYLFVVSDGRTNSSEGLTLDELAEFMQSLGVTTAYNLDGGGSSTMVFQGEVINHPTTTGTVINERSISDIIYIG